MTYNNNIKKSIYKWRENNSTEFKDYMNSYMSDYYKTHSDYFKRKRRELYKFKKEAEIFRNILL